MKIAIGCDPNAEEAKQEIIAYIEKKGYGEVTDFGSEDPIYANVAIDVAEHVASGEYDRGVLICGTGLGVSIAANKVKGAYAGAISILSLNDGPFFTMIAMGTAGMASIPIESFIATLIPLIIGIIWGNLDKTFRKVAADAMPIITFFMMIPIGAGMSLKSIALGGVGGVVLAIISALSAFLFYFLFQLTLPKNKRNAMGAAIGTTAANATSVPASLAEVDPAWQSAASTATAQLAVAAIVTAFTAPIITSMCDKHMRKKKLGIYSDAAIAEREAKEKQGA